MPGWGAATMWTFAGITAISSLVGVASLATRPKTVDYGSNVTYEGDTIYVNGSPQGTAEEYYDQAQQLADSGRDVTPAMNANEWQPLGVFSVAPPGQQQSSMIFQLAINKDGVIGGNYLNQITDESQPVSGKLDKKTQRVSWTAGPNSKTVFDTSFGNLTQDESTCLVHYGPNSTQQMALIRLPDPGNSQSGQQPNQMVNQ